MSVATDRSMLKRQYERFCQAWRAEKRFQEFTLAQGEPLPQGQNKLGKKPTFKMWLQAVKNKKIAHDVQAQLPKAEGTGKVEVTDTEWEE